MLPEGVDISTLVVVAALALTALALMVAHKRWALLAFGLMIFAGAIGPVIQVEERVYGIVTPSFLQPLQMQRPVLFVAAGAGLLLGTLIHVQKLRLCPPSTAGVSLVLMGMFCGVMEFVHTSPESGFLTLGTCLLTIAVTAVCIPMLIIDSSDWQWLLRSIAIAAVLWVGAAALQAVLNVRGVQLGASNRFRGMASNPQHAATFLAVSSSVLLFLVTNETSAKWRSLWFATLPLAVGMLLWTGSRTGVGMLGIGVVAVLWRRFGRSILVLPVLGVGMMIFLSIMKSANVDVGLERLVSTDDTRSGAWARMLENALESPFLGVGVKDAGASENSYLLAFAGYGVTALAIALTVLFTGLYTAWTLFRTRGRYQAYFQHRCDLLVALIGMILAGTMFEGYLVGRVSAMLPILASMLALAAVLIRTARNDNTEAIQTNYKHSYDPYE